MNLLKIFINIDNITTEQFFPNKIERIPIVKEIQVNSFIKSEKNRIQVVNQKLSNTEKIYYNMKNKKITKF